MLDGLRARGGPEQSGVARAQGAPGMERLRLTIGSYTLTARLERQRAPKTCDAFERLLPLRARLIHVRWSGEAVWVPLGDRRLDVGFEDASSYPPVGEILVYPGGVSEMEVLIPYGPTCFASKAGQLAGNPLATIVEGRERLREIGLKVLWEGAQEIAIDAG